MAKPAQLARPTSSRRSTRVVSGASAVSTRSARSTPLASADPSTGLTRSTSSRRRLATAADNPPSDPEQEPEPEPEPENDEKPTVTAVTRKRSSRSAPDPAPEPAKRPRPSRPASVSKPISATEKGDPPADPDLVPTRRQRKTRDSSVPRSSNRPARVSSIKSRLSQSTREKTQVIHVVDDAHQTHSGSPQTGHQNNQMHLDAEPIQEDGDHGLRLQAANQVNENRQDENLNDLKLGTLDKQNDPADLEASGTENLEHATQNGLDKPDDDNLEPTGQNFHSAPDLADSLPLPGPSPFQDGQLETQSDHQPLQDRSTPAMAQPPTPIAPRPPPLTPMKMSIESTVRAGEPRLVIHQIVLKNFKSYAGRQVIGPFHKSFSAIVGPNGSGKSNTIDALLFVFGFKATKMRQGKLSELIHNSSASPSGGFESCSVENGPDDYTIVPNSSLVVARTATRANQSKYTINGQLSNFKEVTTLLKAKGIDLDHKRFLILQGEVESIAQMKPKAVTEHDEGLLEYLEDIIGTNRFREPITGAVGELERLGALRAQKLERVKLVEREKRALEARKALADEYLARTNLLIQQQNMLWQFYIWTASENVGEYTGKIAEIVAEMEASVAAHEGDIKESEKLEKELAEKEAEYKEVEAETNSFVKDLERKEREIVSLGEKTKHARGKLKKLKKSIAEDESALNAANSTIKNAGLEITKLRADLEIKEASIEKDEAELYRIRDSLKDKTQVFADQIEAKQAELAPWMAQVTSKKAALELATSERDLLVKKTADVEAALAAAEETVARIEAERGSKSEQLKTLKKEQKEYQQGIRDAQNELEVESHMFK